MLNQCYQSKSSNNKKGKTMDAYHPDQIDQTIPEQNIAEESMIRKELGHLIETAINQLPEPYKIVFTLRELNQHSVAETAELLNITESNVKVRLNRAKAMIKVNLHSKYGSEYVFEFNEVYCNHMVKKVLDKIL
jgi:RNA polymerase sigma-70 factor (ECF subfamily)